MNSIMQNTKLTMQVKSNSTMIKSNRLPNLQNLGVNFRILIIVNTALTLMAAVLSSNTSEFFTLITSISVLAQPMLLLSLLLNWFFITEIIG